MQTGDGKTCTVVFQHMLKSFYTLLLAVFLNFAKGNQKYESRRAQESYERILVWIILLSPTGNI